LAELKVIIDDRCPACRILISILSKAGVKYDVEFFDPSKHKDFISRCGMIPIIIYRGKVLCGLPLSEIEKIISEMSKHD